MQQIYDNDCRLQTIIYKSLMTRQLLIYMTNVCVNATNLFNVQKNWVPSKVPVVFGMGDFEMLFTRFPLCGARAHKL